MLELEKSGFKSRLNDLCKSNLGDQKTDSFENFSTYHKEGKWAELIDYCLNDVRLTEELFRMVMRGEKIKFKDALDTKEFILTQPVGKKIEFGAHPDSIF